MSPRVTSCGNPDWRKSKDIDGRACARKSSPLRHSGCVFVFRSRSGTAIRLLPYGGQGFGRPKTRSLSSTFNYNPKGSTPAVTGLFKQLDQRFELRRFHMPHHFIDQFRYGTL